MSKTILSGRARIAAHTGRDVIQFEIIADAPTDVVVGARGVAAHPDGPDYAAGTVVQRESSTKTFTPPIFLPTIDRSPCRNSSMAPCTRRWCRPIAVLQAIEASAGLDRRIKIGRR